jgi:ABC-type transport system substrate-binding protein
MKLTSIRNLFSVLLVFSLILTGCSGISAQSSGSANFTAMKVEAEDCSYGGEIKSVEAVDAYTVKFTLCSADAAFPKKMTSPILAIQDKDFLDSHNGDSLLMTDEINGTGPFTVVTNEKDLPILLKVSPTYWGTPPRVTSIYFHMYADATSYQYRSLGDVLNTIDPSALGPIQQDKAFTGLRHDSLDLAYIGFNNKISPMNDLAVRQAIAYVIDQAKITQSFLASGSETATQVIPSYSVSGRTNSLGWYQVDVETAKRKLETANFDFSQTITLAYVDSPSTLIQNPGWIAAEVKDELAAIGVNVELQPLRQENFDSAIWNGTAMMFIDTYKARYNDGAAFYEIPLLRDVDRFGDPYSVLQQELYGVQSAASSSTRQVKFDLLNQDFKNFVPFIPLGFVAQWSFFRSTISSASTNSSFENYEDLSPQTVTIQVYEKTRPVSLWPSDETSDDTFRVTRLIYDTLLTEGYGSTGLQPSLADSWESNDAMTEWTFYLRYNVKFSNGASLDANDVVASFAAIWDAKSPNHTGRTGEFVIFKDLFGSFVNND